MRSLSALSVSAKDRATFPSTTQILGNYKEIGEAYQLSANSRAKSHSEQTWRTDSIGIYKETGKAYDQLSAEGKAKYQF